MTWDQPTTSLSTKGPVAPGVRLCGRQDSQQAVTGRPVANETQKGEETDGHVFAQVRLCENFENCEIKI